MNISDAGAGAVSSANVNSASGADANYFFSNSSQTLPESRNGVQFKAGGALCVACKGRLWCKVSSCPLLDRVAIVAPKELKLKKDVFGPSPPSVFCGWRGYPNVFLGPLVAYDDSKPSSEAALLDDPVSWYGFNFAKIIEMRSSLARGKQKVAVKMRGGLAEELRATVMSSNSVDMEVKFDKVPKFAVSFSEIAQPLGPSANMESLRVVGNASVPRKISSIASEGLKVREALPEILSHGYDEYYLQKLLCAGILGRKAESKLVPTRWSITAADRMVADFYIENLKQMPQLNEIRVYSNEYLYNHFEILLLPGPWEFEQFESWTPGTIWTPQETTPHIAHEYEPFNGRSDYAETEGGGYYAGRIAVSNALANKLGRQARAVVFREIYEGYKCPVGVWEIRENIRHAFENAPQKFSSIQEALKNISQRLKNPVHAYLRKSRIMTQSKITNYF